MLYSFAGLNETPHLTYYSLLSDCLTHYFLRAQNQKNWMPLVIGSRLFFVAHVAPLQVIEVNTSTFVSIVERYHLGKRPRNGEVPIEVRKILLMLTTFRGKLTYAEIRHTQNYGVIDSNIRGGSNFLRIAQSLFVGIVHKVYPMRASDGLYAHNIVLLEANSVLSSFKIVWISEDFK